MLSDLSICRALIAKKLPLFWQKKVGHSWIRVFVAMSTLKAVIVAVSKDQWEECFSVSKRGENIYKRKDGRWEGRYIKERSADGKARYAYVYGKSYADAKQKLLDRRIAQAQNIDWGQSQILCKR